MAQDNIESIVDTALAGQYLGMKLIYLEAGSGALQPVSTEIVKRTSYELDLPLIVGGGLRTPAVASAALSAGADLIVVGNILEKDPALITALTKMVADHNKILSQ